MSEEPLEDSLPKHSRRTAAAWNAVGHFTAVVLLLVQGVLLAPLYLHYLDAELYGAWLAVGTVVAWLQLADPGVSRILMQRIAAASGAGSRDHLSSLITTGVMLGVPVTLVPLLAIPFTSEIVSYIPLSGVGPRAELAEAVFYALLASHVTLLAFIPGGVAIGLQMARTSLVAHALGSIAGITGTIAMLHAGLGVISLPLGLLIRSGSSGLVNLFSVGWWLSRHGLLRVYFVRGGIREFVGTSAVMFVSRLGETLVSQLDPIFAAQGGSTIYTARLGLTTRPYDLGQMLGSRVVPALVPGLSHLHGEGGRPQLIGIIEKLAAGLGLIVGFTAGSVVALNGVFVGLWVGPDMYAGGMVSGLLAIQAVAYVFRSSLNELVYAVGALRANAVTMLSEGVARLLCQIAVMHFLSWHYLPLGAITSIALTSLWLSPLFLARQLELPVASVARTWAAAAARAMILIGSGIAIERVVTMLDLQWSWGSFVLAAAAVAVVQGTLGLAVFSEVRKDVTRLIYRVNRRAGQAAGGSRLCP